METLPVFVPHSISVLIAPAEAAWPLFERVAQLALQGPLLVLDGGNTFQGYALVRALYRRAPAQADQALRRVLLSRVFTCYQMVTRLEETAALPVPSVQEAQPSEMAWANGLAPVLVLDFLSTFYDQNVRAAERERLLGLCLRQIQILSRRVPVAVWLRQRPVIPQDAVGFVERVTRGAGQVWQAAPAELAAPVGLAAQKPAFAQAELFAASAPPAVSVRQPSLFPAA